MDPNSPRFQQYLSRARALLGSPDNLRRVLAQARDMLDGRIAGSAALQKARSDIETFSALLRSWLSGEYRGVERSSVVMLAAALLYLITPLDAVPDFIPIGGLVDDAAVIAAVARRLRSELAAFRAWQAARRAPAEAGKNGALPREVHEGDEQP